MKIKYTAAKAITPVRIIEDAEVCAENGVIVGVGRRDRSTGRCPLFGAMPTGVALTRICASAQRSYRFT